MRAPIGRPERGDKVSRKPIEKLRDAFEKTGVIFIAEDGGGPWREIGEASEAEALEIERRKLGSTALVPPFV